LCLFSLFKMANDPNNNLVIFAACRAHFFQLVMPSISDVNVIAEVVR